MPKQTKTQACPECGGSMRYEKHADKLRYKAHTRTIKTLGWWCTKCGEGILAGDALRGHEKAVLEFKADIDHVLSPSEVAAVREKLGLSQRKAGEILGGGPRAFQKYESGSQAVSAPMSNLLRLLAKDPSRLQDLARQVSRGGERRRAA
jgi:HTH-type transcriptional regulator/antitoxin MqsA